MEFIKRLYYTLSTIARRINNKVKESYSYLFVVAIAGLFSVLAVVTQPFFVSPLQWSNFSWFNFQVVFSRFIVASPLIALFVVAIIFLPKQIRKIDDKRDEKLANKITDGIKDAFKEAMVEFRETLKDDANKSRLEKYNRNNEAFMSAFGDKDKLGLNKNDTDTP
jgi:hypothetical protein